MVAFFLLSPVPYRCILTNENVSLSLSFVPLFVQVIHRYFSSTTKQSNDKLTCRPVTRVSAKEARILDPRILSEALASFPQKKSAMRGASSFRVDVIACKVHSPLG